MTMSRAAQLDRIAKGARITTDRNIRQKVSASGGTSSAIARAIFVFTAQNSAVSASSR